MRPYDVQKRGQALKDEVEEVGQREEELSMQKTIDESKHQPERKGIIGRANWREKKVQFTEDKMEALINTTRLRRM